MWPPIWTRMAAFGLCRGGFLLKVRERHAEVLAVAVDELHLGAGADRGQRRGHERVRGAQHGVAGPTPAKCSAAIAPPAQLETAPRPASLCAAQACSKRSVKRRLGPPLGVEHLVDQLRAGGRGRDRQIRSRIARSAGVVEAVVMRGCAVQAGRGLRRPQRAYAGQAFQTGRTVSSSRCFRVSRMHRKRPRGAPVRVASAVEIRVVQEDHVARRASRVARAAIRSGVVNLRQSLPQRDHSSGSR